MKPNWRSFSATVRKVFMKLDANRQLAELRVPATVLYGSADGLSRHTKALETRISSRFVQFRRIRGGHQLPLQHPRLVAAAIREAAAHG
jgi:pimeloyl-ACP methyl ester carboxylesterase